MLHDFRSIQGIDATKADASTRTKVAEAKLQALRAIPILETALHLSGRDG